MSATIVRIEGDIIYHQQALEKLVVFLSKQSTPHLLVVTALPELAQAIRSEIVKAHEPEYSQVSIEGILENLESLINSPAGNKKESEQIREFDKRGEFRRQCERLTGLLRGIHLTGDYSAALKDQVVSFGEQLTALLVAARLEQTLSKPHVQTASANPEVRDSAPGCDGEKAEQSRNSLPGCDGEPAGQTGNSLPGCDGEPAEQSGNFLGEGKQFITVTTPEELGLRVTADYGSATFTALEHPEELVSIAGQIVVVPGSYGIAPNGKIARTGRSAADYTSAFLAGALGAERLVLWNLAVEFTSADPEIVAEAGTLRYLTYAEASELSYFDHFDFHPRTVEPLQPGHIPIHILSASTADFLPDTVINSEEHPSKTVVKSIASTDDLSVLKLNGPGVGLKPGILARITSQLSKEGINIKSVITSQVSINILLGREDGQAARKIAEQLGFTAVSEITLLDEVTLVAIVGHGMQDHYGISARLFTAFAENKINVILSGSGASDLVSYLVIAEQDKQKCIKAVYKAFLED